MNFRLFSVFFLQILSDFFRIPLQKILSYYFKLFNIIKSNNKEIRGIKSGASSDFFVVMHNYAKRGQITKKSKNGIDYYVGVKPLLDQFNNKQFHAICYVEESNNEYLQELRSNYKFITFIPTNSKKFDFYTYFIAPHKSFPEAKFQGKSRKTRL